MKTRFGRTLIAILALAGAACASPQLPSPLPARASGPSQGLLLVEIHCVRCHAIGAAGESRHPMAPAFRRLSRNYPVNTLEEAFAEGILVGHRDMPHFVFEPAEIEAILAYLNSIQEQRGG